MYVPYYYYYCSSKKLALAGTQNERLKKAGGSTTAPRPEFRRRLTSTPSPPTHPPGGRRVRRCTRRTVCVASERRAMCKHLHPVKSQNPTFTTRPNCSSDYIMVPVCCSRTKTKEDLPVTTAVSYANDSPMNDLEKAKVFNNTEKKKDTPTRQKKETLQNVQDAFTYVRTYALTDTRARVPRETDEFVFQPRPRKNANERQLIGQSTDR